jgi:hypothetical protein
MDLHIPVVKIGKRQRLTRYRVIPPVHRRKQPRRRIAVQDVDERDELSQRDVPKTDAELLSKVSNRLCLVVLDQSAEGCDSPGSPPSHARNKSPACL